MAVEDLLRDFSESKKNELKSIITNLNENNKTFLGEEKDYFSDKLASLSRGIFGYDIKNYVDDIETYHTEILDMENMGSDRIDEIFNAVAEVDSRYSVKFKEKNDLLDQIQLIMSNLTTVFNGSAINPDGNIGLSREDFSMDLLLEGSVEIYFSLLTNGKDGEKYNWDYISELMKKDPKEISDAEHEALVMIIDLFMNTADGQAVDIENYTRFLRLLYINPKGEHSNYGTEYTYELSPIVVDILKKYCEVHAEDILNATVKSDYKQYYFNIDLLSSILSIKEVKYQSSMLFDGSIKLEKSKDSNRSKYDYDLKVSKDGNGVYQEYNIVTYDDGAKLKDYLYGKTVEFVESGKSNPAMDAVVNTFTIVADAIHPKLGTVATAICAGQAIIASSSGLDNNIEISKLTQAEKLGKTMEAFGASASLIISNNKVNLNNVTIDKEDLEVRLWFYSEYIKTNTDYANYQPLSIDEVNEFLNDPQNNGDMAGALGNYCNWYITDGKDYLDKFDSTFEREVNNGNTELSCISKNYNELTIEEKESVIPTLIEIIENERLYR